MCPLCAREDDVFLVAALPDGRREVECKDCDYRWTHGSVVVEKPVVRRAATARASTSRTGSARSSTARTGGRTVAAVMPKLPQAADVTSENAARADRLKQDFLSTVATTPDPAVAPHWAKYQWVLSADGLKRAVPYDLTLFANDPTGADPGDVSELNKARTLLGEAESDRRVRQMLEHLLRGPGQLEDRLSSLVYGEHTYSMTGFNEALLTKALAVVHPDRFLPILTHDRRSAIVEAVYGLQLPVKDATSWPIGRLAVWSNDLMVVLLGDGFDDLHHAARFLRWANSK